VARVTKDEMIIALVRLANARVYRDAKVLFSFCGTSYSSAVAAQAAAE
jgi:hypothetical protein